MTASEAIKWLTDIIDEATRNEESVYYATLDDADALNTAIEALKRNQWTPCSEPPKKEGEYLCCDKEGSRWVDNFQDGVWFMEIFSGIEWLAWMPLPEPWKGEIDG